MARRWAALVAVVALVLAAGQLEPELEGPVVGEEGPAMTSAPGGSLVICAPTFFKSKEVPRYAATLATLEACRERGYQVVLVDGSPEDTGISEALREAGAHVVREAGRGKAAALRQALSAAAERFPGTSVFAFQESEKTDFVRFYEVCMPGMLGSESEPPWDFCNPARSEASWKTYPVEQEHEERFQNRLMDLCAQRFGFGRSLDWSFGPFLLQGRYLQDWLAYQGETYDAQWGPLVRAFKANNSIVIGTPEVDYKHSEFMKLEEEGSWPHAMRRLTQLQDVVAAFQTVWEDGGDKRD